MEIDLDALNARMSGLPAYLGIRFVEARKDRLVAERLQARCSEGAL